MMCKVASGIMGKLTMVAHVHQWDAGYDAVLIYLAFMWAISGFHSLVASGTSKQLSKRTDAVAVGFGSMLIEGAGGDGDRGVLCWYWHGYPTDSVKLMGDAAWQSHYASWGMRD